MALAMGRISMIIVVSVSYMDNVLRLGVVSTSYNTQAGGTSLAGFPRLLIQYIRSYPPRLEVVPPPAT
jgi:hypothetical protein